VRITTRARYALRASLALAKLGSAGDMVSISALSEAEGISSVFLEQIFLKLRKAGIVRSVRGPGGGFCFSQPLDQLTVKDILEATGEILNGGNCDKSRDDCDRIGTCLSHPVWQGASAAVMEYLESITVASLLKKKARTRKKQSHAR